MQNENVGHLVQNYLAFQGEDNRVLNQAQNPPECRILFSGTGCMPKKPALTMLFHNSKVIFLCVLRIGLVAHLSKANSVLLD